MSKKAKTKSKGSNKPKSTEPTKEAEKIVVVPESEEDDLQALMDATVTEEVLSKPLIIAGIHLKPITLETVVTLKQINSPLITGVSVEEIDNLFLECVKFLTLQKTFDEDRVIELAWDEKALVKASLETARGISVDNAEYLFTAINTAIADASSTRVNAQPKKGDEDTDAGLGN